MDRIRKYKKHFELDAYRNSERYKHLYDLVFSIKHSILDSRTTERWEGFRPDLEALRNSLLQSEEVRRLNALLQIGYKSSPANIRRASNAATEPQAFSVAGENLFHRPSAHTRLDHSLFIAELTAILGAKLGFSLLEIKTAYAGAMLHDVGHSVLNHVMDRFLQKNGFPDHEDRGLVKIAIRFSDVLALHGLTIEGVQAVILEQGRTGMLQYICDTLSYLYFDCKEMKEQSFKFDFQDLLAIIEDIAEVVEQFEIPDEILESKARVETHRSVARKQSVFRVKSSGDATHKIWHKSFLQKRASLYERLYNNPDNNLQEKARLRLIDLLLQRQILSFDQILQYGEQEMRLTLQDLVYNTVPEYTSLYRFAFGIHKPDEWVYQEFSTHEEMMQRLNVLPSRILSQTVSSDAPATGKTLVLLDGNEQPVFLYATSVIPESARLKVSFPRR